MTTLIDPILIGEWVTFSNSTTGEWVVSGAYYLDGGE